MDSSPTTTTTTTATSTPSPPFPSSSLTTPTTPTSDTLQLVAISVVGIVSTVANLLVMLTILMTRKLRSTSSSVLVTSLAAADLAVTSMTVPLVACGLVHKRWIFSQVTCSVTSTLIGVFSAASALSVAAIAMDRYLAILHCLRYSAWPRWRYVLSVLASTWLPALLFGVLLSSGQAATVAYVPNVYVCDVVATRSIAYVWTRAVVVFIFPLIVLAFAYARVIRVARVHSRKIDVVVPGSRKFSSETSRRSDSVRTNGAVAAGAMFSVRRLSILSIPQRAESGRQQFRITGDLELVSASPAVVQEDGSQSPQRRSCTSLKLVLLVFVFALCGGFHTALSLFQSVCHRPEDCTGVLAAGTPDQAGSLVSLSRHAGGASNATSGKNAGSIEEVLADKGQQHQQLLRAAFWLLLVNSMLNPFLYAISSQRFRYFAARLFSRQHPNGGGGDPHGGHLFDISIYSAFLRNLHTPSRHSSADSGDMSQQQFALTTLANSDGGDRRDSGSSVGTSSTLVESTRGLSPLPSHELPPRNGSPQFLEVPRSLAGDHNSLSRVLTALPPVEDTVELRRSDVVFRRQASATSTSSVCSDSCSRRGSGRGSFQGVDDFVFSSNNIARIRIVLDLV